MVRMTDNPAGGYRFIRGISPYSAGAAALPGFEVIHARFERPVPLRAGFDRVSGHLDRLGRPKQSLCGMELRSPKPFTFQGFIDFNKGYVDVLKSWNILLEGGVNPVARTNVAPETGAPSEPCLYGFSYTMPASHTRKTFVIAGAGELPEGSLDPHDVVRRGETSPAAIQAKLQYVMGLMEGRMKGLGVGWEHSTVTEVYTVHNIHSLLPRDLCGRMKAGNNHGFVWHYSRPPIVSIEYEMDVRGCLTELVLPAGA
ncbi:MAG: hypothetical protein FJW40_09150 [Acidobacteria bacterium]|nr:hypothetical protein [Acidobacteriota bacterium]